MTAQKASLARMVLVTVDPRSNNGSGEAVAVIVRAWSDECVNVRVLRDGPDVAWLTSVPLFQTREDLEVARAKWAEQVGADPATYHAAYWPPRV